MKINTASIVILAAAIVGGVSSRRVLQEAPRVGLDTTSPPDFNTSEPDTTTSSAQEDLILALEFDAHITVVSPIEMGELMCSSLVLAEDADTLSFVITNDDVIVAEKSSYTVISGDVFTGNIGRKVWSGVVTDPAQAEDEAVPRTVSMTWGDACSTETFLLQVTKMHVDQTTSIVKTIPCLESTTRICLFEDDEGSTRDDSDVADPDSRARRLQPGITVVDVMVLYSSESLISLGITTMQMETNIIEATARANEAFVNSNVALSLNPVHIGPLPFAQPWTTTLDGLIDITDNVDIGMLRDEMGADLVQVVGDFDDNYCGRGWTFVGNARYGFSVVEATCLADRMVANVYGHNLDCYANREDTDANTQYAHGLRYCSGVDPYRTIMSHTCGSPFVNYFSNPDVVVLDKPTGTATEDNARAIEDNMVVISNYRLSVPDTPPPTSMAPSTAPLTTAPVPVPPTPTTASPMELLPTTAPPTAPPITAPPTAYTLEGCYRDKVASRTLSGAYTKGSRTMTTEVCAANCQGSPYFGTEFGVECFCGVESDDPDEFGEAVCNFECAGDPSQACGGFNAISVYTFGTDGPPPTPAPLTPGQPTPTPPTPEFLGCWADRKGNRLMTLVESNAVMTIEACAEICSASPFFGTQWGKKCWCGDESTDFMKNGESLACDRACTGDSTQTCGGFDAMSVYHHGAAVAPPEFLGCWTDTLDGRIMEWAASTQGMTNYVCEGICSAHEFFGTQFAQECWCGDDDTDHTVHEPSTSCTMPCTGDADTTCGGVFAMSVWQHQ